jgi:hypothetical protein
LKIAAKGEAMLENSMTDQEKSSPSDFRRTRGSGEYQTSNAPIIAGQFDSISSSSPSPSPSPSSL